MRRCVGGGTSSETDEDSGSIKWERRKWNTKSWVEWGMGGQQGREVGMGRSD